jgi:tetratricopeptide (TPR) repeat protein
MRREIEYHSLYIPKKPVLVQKTIIQPEYVQPIKPIPAPTIQEKDEQIKHISFVFETEADELAIMNKIANSINKFVDISDKKSQALDEVKDLSLVDLINLAKKEEQNYEYLKAVMIYQKALTLNNDDDYYTFLPTLYSRLAQAFKCMSDWFNAQKYFELALEFYISTGDVEKINEYKFEIANIFYITFKSDRAEKLLKEILSENLSINLSIKAKLLLASITPTKLEIPQSVEEIEKPVLAELYFKYAVEKDDEGDITNAVKYYKKCVETSQDVKINSYLSSALSNLASIYDENGKSELAIKYLNESLRLDELSKNYNGMYISIMKLAEINSANALDYLQRAKKCAQELNEPFYITSTDIALGDYYTKQKDYKNALQCYNNAYEIANKDFNKDNIEKIQARINDIKKVYNE